MVGAKTTIVRGCLVGDGVFLGGTGEVEFDRVSKRKDEGGEDEESELEDAESRKSYSYVNLLTLFRIDIILIVDQGPITTILDEDSNLHFPLFSCNCISRRLRKRPPPATRRH